MKNIGLFSTMNYVEAPFIKVSIGDYTFGVYDVINEQGIDIHGAFKLNKIKFPNYIQSLSIEKINGVLNKYTLNLEYTITENDDPNFFEKIFSSVSESRTIVFSYGDFSAPDYIYRDEEAIINKVSSNFNIQASKISYTVTAVSKAMLLRTGAYTFRERMAQPSTVIKELLYSPDYGLCNIFTAMQDRELVDRYKLIPDNDLICHIDLKTNISPLEYLYYLVDCMSISSNPNIKKNSFFTLLIEDDTTIFHGTYFKIVETNTLIQNSDAYNVDIGYPSKNLVLDFKIINDENYSILYNYQDELNDARYVQRINSRGEIEEVYAPILSSGNDEYWTRPEDKTWWSRVTTYPVKASITLKGLFRPALLMSYLRLNVYLFGKKHISSGLYIITKQQDTVDSSGFRTVLNMVRVGSDENNTPL